MFHSHKHTLLTGLLTLFLTGSIVVTSTLVSNPNISLDIRNYATGDNWMNEPTLTVNSVKTTVDQKTGTAHSTVSYTQGGVTNTINSTANVDSKTGNRAANTTTTNSQGNVIARLTNTDTMNNSGQLTQQHTVDTRTNADGTTSTYNTTVNVNSTTGQRSETTTKDGVVITQNGQFVNGYTPPVATPPPPPAPPPTSPPTLTSAPDLTPAPPTNPTCGAGYKLNTSTHQCDQDMNPDRIDQLSTNCNARAGMHYDQETGNCLSQAQPTTAPRTICPAGSTYNNSANTCDKVVTTTEKTDNGFVHDTTTISTDPTTHKIVNANTVSLNPTVTYTPTCSSGYSYNSATHQCTPTSQTSGIGATGTANLGTTKLTGTDCTANSQCGSGRCGRAPHVSGAEAANAGHTGNFCQPSDAEINHTVTVELAVVGGGLAAAAILPEVAAGGAISTAVTTASQAVAAYGGVAVSSAMAGLSPLAQIGLGAGITAFTLGGTVSMGNECAKSNWLDPKCALLAAPMINDIAGTAEGLLAGPQMVSQGIRGILNPTSALNGYTLLGDIHSDPKAAIKYLQEQGVLDQYGKLIPGQKIISVGDLFGKTSTDLSPIGGNQALDLVNSLPGIKLAGNWEPKCVAGVCALNSGDTATLNKLVDKTLSLADVQLAAADPAAFAQRINQLDYVNIIPGNAANTVAQHVDTPELARFALSSTDLVKLSKSNPELAQQITNIVNLNSTYTPLSTSDLTAINQAVKEVGLNPTAIASNINNQAHDIVTYALTNPSNSTAINNLDVLQKTMNADLTFYGPDSSQMIGQYSNMFNADTLLHGHSPVVNLQTATRGVTADMQALVGGSSYHGVYTDPITGVTLTNIDANISSAMRTPTWIQNVVNGVTQIPTGMAPYLPQTTVPTFLQVGSGVPTIPLFGTP